MNNHASHRYLTMDFFLNGFSKGTLWQYFPTRQESLALRFVSEQGVKMGRRSILHVQLNGEKDVKGIEIGGYVSPVAEATMDAS